MSADDPARDRLTELTLDAIRVEHAHLLDIGASSEVQLAVHFRNVRRFVDRLIADGVYFDEPVERRTMQSYVDYWAHELSARASGQDDEKLSGLEIGAFSEDALRALQDRGSNPFATLSTQWASLPSETACSPSGLLKWLEERAQSAGLRLQAGLLKQISSQVATDPEGARLAEFCLCHLFDGDRTRVGNKVRRPQGEDTFSCTTYLRDEAEALRDAQGQPQAKVLMKGLARFQARASTAGSAWLRRQRLPRASFGGFKLGARADLTLERFLLDSRLVFAEGDDLVLVHESLRRQWVSLAAEISARQARVKMLYWTAGVVGILAAMAFGAWVGIEQLERKRSTEAMREASAATSQGGVGGAMVDLYVQSYEQYYRANPPASEREYAQALSAAAFSALGKFTAQVDHSLRALHAKDTAHVRKVANDAIASTLGFLARAGRLGPLDAYPRLQECSTGSSEYCVRVGDASYFVPVTHPVARETLAASSRPGYGRGTAVIDPGGEYLAVAWLENNAYQVKAFAIPAAPLPSAGALPGLREITSRMLSAVQCAATDPAPRLRFSSDSGLLVFECLVDGQVQWAYIELGTRTLVPAARNALAHVRRETESVRKRTGEAFKPHGGPDEMCPLHVGDAPAVMAEVLPNQADSVFFGESRSDGTVDTFVTAGPDGYIRLWHEPPVSERTPPQAASKQTLCPLAQFYSDFVRMTLQGRPAHLAFRQTRDSNHFAVLQEYPPVIRVFEQEHPMHAEMLMEHYPAPGLGDILGMRFSNNGRCLKVQVARGRPLTREGVARAVRFDYPLILDKEALLSVGGALREDVRSLTATSHSAPKLSDALPNYLRAVREVCGPE